MDNNLCVGDCKRCSRLVDSRSQIVNGVGPTDSDLVLVGEAPGENEDKNGEPFVGKSGKLLNEELESNGVSRDQVRITNTVRCRPPDNKDPKKSEVENCNEYLVEEISSVDPEVVLTLGRVPTQALLENDASVTKISGEIHVRFIGDVQVKVVSGMHPAATFYDPSYKEMFEEAIETAVEQADL